MPITVVRQLTAEDADGIQSLGRLAFGAPPAEPTDTVDWLGMTRWGISDSSGRLLAKASDREHAQWFGGRCVVASGIAGVAVAPEARGRGLAHQVTLRCMQQARDRGAVISTLYPTAPQLYRRLGYEQVGFLHSWELPTSALDGIRVPPGITLRAATAEDLPRAREVYDAVAADTNGFLRREAPLFDWAEELDEVDGMTLACDADGTVLGYCSWQRGQGYDAKSRVTVNDLFATSPPATRALLAALGSWSAVTGTIGLGVRASDAVHFELPRGGLRPTRARPWMLAILDAPGAIAARGWPACVAGSADLELHDGEAAVAGGAQRLAIDGGQARLEPGGTGATRLHMRGLAVLYAGNADPALLRRAGLLSGGDAGSDAFLAAAFSGPAPATADYF